MSVSAKSVTVTSATEAVSASSRPSQFLRFRLSAFRLALALVQASRPRIVALVLFTMTVTAIVAAPQTPAWPILIHALAGSALVIVGAIALNQWLEHTSDAKMPRTATRPLPTGRLTARQMTIVGGLTTLAGLIHLWLFVNVSIVVLAAVSWVLYVWIYTPSKRFTPWQTVVGAVAGAMPTLLGGAAADAWMSSNALALFGMVFFWQLPHAMAVAWLYRGQFASANVKLATVLDPSGRFAGLLAVLGAVALVPVSLVPVFTGTANWGYGLLALVLAGGYLAAAIQFLLTPSDAAARPLLRASLLYLPVAFIALLAAMPMKS
jgi:protoheme IX farnesyltransferase